MYQKHQHVRIVRPKIHLALIKFLKPSNIQTTPQRSCYQKRNTSPHS